MKTRLTERIKSKAYALGFQKVGIAKVEPIPEARDNLEAWINRGNHATMGWLEKRREERGDLHVYFPEARSIIAVGLNYYTGLTGEIMEVKESRIKFSNYAWGDDYHVLLKNRLYDLLYTIQEINPHVRGRVCVDTAPVMEKVWAQKAGLGWQGKHTNLITRDYGSWLFLGELIVDVDLEPDPTFLSDLCGSCTACIDACPTQALADYRIDANRCISYLTIEHRDELPESLREDFQGWIYGCDICQEVCPWNRKFQVLSQEPAFQAREEIRLWDTAGWVNLDEDEYKNIFKDSPAKRTKFTGLKRNIEFVMKGKEGRSNSQ